MALAALQSAVAKRKEKADAHTTTNLDVGISKIRDGLWLGNSVDAENKPLLQEKGITHILNCADDVPTPAHAKDFKYLRLDLQDAPEARGALLEVMRSGGALDFIEEARTTGGGVIVHCQLGRSRSASIVLSYMMSRLKCTYADALAEVKKKRQLYGGSLVDPNPGFKQVLAEFEVELQGGRAAAAGEDAQATVETPQSPPVEAEKASSQEVSATGKGKGKGKGAALPPPPPPRKDVAPVRPPAPAIRTKVRNGELRAVPESKQRIASRVCIDEPMHQICLSEKMDEEREKHWRNALYLGGLDGAQMQDALEIRNIKLIVSILHEELQFEHCSPDIEFWRSPSIYDEATPEAANALLSIFDEVHAKIDAVLQTGGSVLVHCRMGVSRSATVVTAYVMRKLQIGRGEALQRVKECRRIANPNLAFREVLLEFEKQVCVQTASS